MKQRVLDKVRRRRLVLTPEEGVRRSILTFLTTPTNKGGIGIAPTLIAQEYPIDLNGTTQRADIVVFSSTGTAQMLIECKAPGVTIDHATLSQAWRYNAIVGAPYIMLTNGTDHYLYTLGTDGEYTAINSFPQL